MVNEALLAPSVKKLNSCETEEALEADNLLSLVSLQGCGFDQPVVQRNKTDASS